MPDYTQDQRLPPEPPAPLPSLFAPPAPPTRVLTDVMVTYLKAASPWLRFLGVLSYIGAGFCALFGAIILITAPLGADFSDVFDIFGDFGAIGGVVLGIFYLAMGGFLFFPARFEYRFGARIRDYSLGNAEAQLEQAFKNVKAYFKFQGILAIIGLAMIPLLIVIAVVAVMAGYY
jgi:hypothetical protein